MVKHFRFFLGLLIGIVVTSLLFSDSVMAERSILVYLNGKIIKADVEPHIVDGRIYLPVRAFCEALGAKVTWDDKNSIVNIVLDNNTTTEAGEEPNSRLIPIKKAPNLVEAYAMVIDEIYTIDPALNDGIKYLAIDTSGMANLTDQEKRKLINLFRDNQYGLIVLNKTHEELIKEGYIKNINDHEEYPYYRFLEGILISITDKPMENNMISMLAMKSRSSLGAMGYGDLKIEYKDGSWVITTKGIQVAS